MPRRSPNALGWLIATSVVALGAFWLGARFHAPRFLQPRIDKSPRATARFFQMGQGCSLLLIAPGGHAVLVDGGSTLTQEDALKAALREAGIPALEAVIVTTCGSRTIGGLPRLLDAIPMRGPVLVPVPVDQFAVQGGRAAEISLMALKRHNLHAYVSRDYLDAHPNLLGVGTLLESHVIPGDPASAAVLHFQCGRANLVDLANLTAQEAQSALTLRKALSCDTLVISDDVAGATAMHEMLALASPRDVVVPVSPQSEPSALALSNLDAAGVRIFRMDGPEPVVCDFDAQGETVAPVGAKSD